MIEEFMLTANEAAATLAMEQEIPFVYRVHEQPPVIKVNLLHNLLTKLGVPAEKLLAKSAAEGFCEYSGKCSRNRAGTLRLMGSSCALCQKQFTPSAISGTLVWYWKIMHTLLPQSAAIRI